MKLRPDMAITAKDLTGINKKVGRKALFLYCIIFTLKCQLYSCWWARRDLNPHDLTATRF